MYPTTPSPPLNLRAHLSCVAFALLSGCDVALGSDAERNGGGVPPLLAETATVGMFADAQYCACPAEGTRHPRRSLGKLRGASVMFNDRQVDFTVNLGDLIHRDIASYAPALDALSGLDAAVYPVLGNHEYSVDRGDRAAVLAALGMDARYYDVTEGRWRFIVLDGNDLSLYATIPGDPRRAESVAMYDSLVASGAANAHAWSGGVGREQLAWLRATLQDALDRGQRVVMLSHFPVYPASGYNLWNDREVLAAVAPFPHVVAHLSGHDHDGRAETHEGVHHIGLAGMVETEGQNAFAVVHFGRETMEIDGYGREPSRRMSYAGDRSAHVRTPVPRHPKSAWPRIAED